jgi:hypothetical protein
MGWGYVFVRYEMREVRSGRYGRTLKVSVFAALYFNTSLYSCSATLRLSLRFIA